MNQEVGLESKSIGESSQSNISSGNHFCPRCGGEMVTASQGVVASFPSPAIERLICSNSSCNYNKYAKLDSSGFIHEGSSFPKKGDQSAK